MGTLRPRLLIYVIVASVILDSIAALLFSAVENISVSNAFYWSVVTVTSVGYGDITPKTEVGKWLAIAVMLTILPLFAALFSLFTSYMTAKHVTKHHGSLHEKLDHIIHYHPDIPVLDQEKG